MKPSAEYVTHYERLFTLIMTGQADSAATKELRAKMDKLFPNLPGRNDAERMRFVNRTSA